MPRKSTQPRKPRTRKADDGKVNVALAGFTARVSEDLAFYVTGTVTVGGSGYALKVHMDDATADRLQEEFWGPAVEAGDSMTALRAQFGPSERIRKARTRAGLNPIGANRGEVLDHSEKARKDALVERLIQAREARKSWNRCAIENKRTPAECRAILVEAGRGDLVDGRVTRAAVKQAS